VILLISASWVARSTGVSLCAQVSLPLKYARHLGLGGGGHSLLRWPHLEVVANPHWDWVSGTWSCEGKVFGESPRGLDIYSQRSNSALLWFHGLSHCHWKLKSSSRRDFKKLLGGLGIQQLSDRAQACKTHTHTSVTWATLLLKTNADRFLSVSKGRTLPSGYRPSLFLLYYETGSL
jgi:hypothetical protein